MAKYYRDIFISKGDDFSEIIDISVPYDEYDFVGVVRSSGSSLIGIPITCSAVEGNLRKMEISIPAELTSALKRRRGLYAIHATEKALSSEQFTERGGTAHYSQSSTFVPTQPPPPEYVVSVENISGVGSAATANIEQFATAAQGSLADSAIQADDIADAPALGSLTNETEFLLKGDPLNSVTYETLRDSLVVEYTYRSAVDSFHAHVFYLGKAIAGSSESALVWTITMIATSPSGNDQVMTEINVAWTNRQNVFP